MLSPQVAATECPEPVRSRVPGRGLQIAEQAGAFLAARPALCVLIFSAIFLPLALAFAWERPVWNDEILTLYLARQPDLRTILDALNHAVDINPPLLHVLTHAAVIALGPHEWVVRLPSIAGFWLMSVCLIYFIRRRLNALWGLAGVLFLLVTKAFYYAHEARPYGLVLGFTAAALLCWQSAVEHRRRALALTGLCAALMLAVATHYYAVLIYFPLAAGEAARAWIMRKVDWAVTACVVFTAPTVLIFLPLIRVGKQLQPDRTRVWNPVKLSIIWETHSYFLLLTPVLLLLLGLLAVAVWRDYREPSPHHSRRWPTHEIVAAVVLLVLPVFGFVVGKTAAGFIHPRYLIPTVLGSALLFVLGAYRITGGGNAAAVVLLLAICGLLAGSKPSQLQEEMGHGGPTLQRLEDCFAELPVVVDSAHDFLEEWHYASPGLRSRLVHVNDVQMARRYNHLTVGDQNLINAMPYFHGRSPSWDEFRKSNQRFLLVSTEKGGWLLSAYQELGASIRLLDHRFVATTGMTGTQYVFLVTDTAYSADR